ncbi:MAG: efflux RND transporter periplasmic adaptor subunit [Acidobacteriia bacterium]|nr:efflux RND transporter periplasmic adaptor subunit [Terriglobia bacterium]
MINELIGSEEDSRPSRTRARTGHPASVLVVVLMASALLAGCGKTKAGPPVDTAAPVVVAAATQRDVPVDVKVVGTVEAYSNVQVKSMIAGEITRLGFAEGQDVRKGSLLFEIDPRPYRAALAQAEGNLARDLAQEANARAQAARYEALYKQGVVSREQNDQMQTAADALKQAVAADRAAVETAKVNLTYTAMLSPLDGRTGNLMVHLGNVVKANDIALITINQVQPIYATFAVPQMYLPEIKKFQAGRKLPVTVRVPNEPKPAEGVLTFIDNTVDQATGTIKLKATFPNSDRRLWPGQFADVSMTLTTDKNAVLVPSAAVQTGQNGQYVFVVKADNTAELRNVTVSRIIGSESVIASGVQPGDQVVTDGQVRLTPGKKVALSKPANSASNTQAATQPGTRQGSGL